MKNYFENENLLSKNQHGFRKKQSTTTAWQLQYFCNSICKQINNGKLTGGVYVDFPRAFDNIGHGFTLLKLSTYGVKDKELEWFNSYLFNRKSYVYWQYSVTCFPWQQKEN